ncbi:Gamma-glutamyltranspeptidase 3 [Hibiscus syriacus]|uniref:Gamma-glutamyltranspeptidase 3 n=1 Tax=Hibiscus syriacus TaxID=106335 RepID=A0A6A2Z9R1_HIBSY|nr:Gamma-glutamyltranspeptidase 3 [Hibiscus syriacus]
MEAPLLALVPNEKNNKRNNRWNTALRFFLVCVTFSIVGLIILGDGFSYSLVRGGNKWACGGRGSRQPAVATTLCVGVVYSMASGIGGGAFMVVWSSSSQVQAFDSREIAPLASSQIMYENDMRAKYHGALSMGVPGEIAGLHEAWLRYGRLDWNTLFEPAIKLAKDGFVIEPYLGLNIASRGSLEELAEHGPGALYNGTIGEKMVEDVDSYGSANAAKGDLGLHRLIEALKHMFAERMNLGDPDFINVTEYVSEMLSISYAKQIQEKIVDDTTFPASYYMCRWSQLRDHGTSHFCVVDAERDAVSMTTTVNYPFGAGVLSPSTGIIINKEMGDFSAPTEISPDMLPPAPANFIRPNKSPLSSMTPLIITKVSEIPNNQLTGVIGGSGGMNIIPAVTQVFLNHFTLGMEPLAAVEHPRIYHKLIPNVVSYENWTCIDGDHIEFAEETEIFLRAKGHQLEPKSGGAIVQFVVQTLQEPIVAGRKFGKDSYIFHGKLTAVSDPRKDDKPAGL